MIGGSARDRTDDLFHAVAQSLAKSTTYNRFWDCLTSVSTWKYMGDWINSLALSEIPRIAKIKLSC
jgi:hypothetical protein